ncbi:glucose-6-phosphate isomerase [soil metagenome]
MPQSDTTSSATSAPSFQALLAHCAEAKDWQLRDLFSREAGRGRKLSLEAAGLFLDYSKNRVNASTMEALFGLARERGVEALRDAMFAGEKINLTEHRAVLHTALRAPRGNKLVLDGHEVIGEVHAVLDRLAQFSELVRDGKWLGCAGKPITDIVNIGIGGSYLGPEMTCRALREFAHPRLKMHFVANVDGHDLDGVLREVQHDTTLFIVASKTFTTAETMMNAHSARAWFLRKASEENLSRHFVAVSTNTEAVQAFGIDPEHMFPFWDWVGGRYSIWSAIGLPLMLSIGSAAFAQFLGGAHAMDQHFRTAPLEKNMPAILALIGVWNRTFLGCPSLSIAPYHHCLKQFPEYLQQLDMESNGKRVSRDGASLSLASSPVIWGDTGTNGQHAYFQMLHQGTETIPVDFIAALKPGHDLPGHHAALLANCFAQSEALMHGKTTDEVRAELLLQNMWEPELEALVPHKVFPGNRSSNTILMDALTPATLGALIALYEHKVFVQGAIWGINSFDQWGVELGKVLAKNIHAELTGTTKPQAHDDSTNALIARARTASEKR